MEVQIRALRDVPAAIASEEDIDNGEVVLRGTMTEGVGESTLRELLRGPRYIIEPAEDLGSGG